MKFANWKTFVFLSAILFIATVPAFAQSRLGKKRGGSQQNSEPAVAPAPAQATTEMTSWQARKIILEKFANIVSEQTRNMGNGIKEDRSVRINAVRITGSKIQYDYSETEQEHGFNYHPAATSSNSTDTIDLKKIGPVWAVVSYGWSPSGGRRGGTFTYSSSTPRECAGYCLINKDQQDYVDSYLMYSSSEDANLLAQALNRLAGSSQSSEEAAAWIDFQQKAAAWRAMAAKPALDAEADRNWVLAENAVKEKKLDAAVEHYQAALAIQPMWPTGWFDLAMIYGEQNNYEDASDAMKRYLELVPNASDAKAARDQMIIWDDKAKQ